MEIDDAIMVKSPLSINGSSKWAHAGKRMEGSEEEEEEEMEEVVIEDEVPLNPEVQTLYSQPYTENRKP